MGAAGVFDRLAEEALTGYDRIVGLDLNDVAVDTTLNKAPCGGGGTGPNPTDRGKSGWKWSISTDRAGIPLGWVAAPANRNDCILLAPTLDGVAQRGLLEEVGTLHLDRGYDYDFVRQDCQQRGLRNLVISRRRPDGQGRHKHLIPLGLRWSVERTNSWLTNYGQLRRNTDRYPEHRLAQFALAITLIITIKLIKWANRWNH